MNTYGFHSIHGRAPTIASGLKASRPELSVWVVTGDGDALSIGGNHLIHALRRNVNVKILLFNNRIYGLTKGQYSPTSELGKVTKSTPYGAPDHPLDPCAFALGAGASFVARTVDVQAKEFAIVLRRAAEHRGASLTEIYQNCNVFNDDAFVSFTDRASKEDKQIFVEHGKPLLFGEGKKKGLQIDPRTLGLRVVTLGDGGVTEKDVLVHDETNPAIATLLARMPFPAFPVAMGVLFASPRPTYEAALTSQHDRAKGRLGQGSLEKLLHSGETWTVT
jgi:2-oxoglutarate ferredoxin oxidoreductase subunit beta